MEFDFLFPHSTHFNTSDMNSTASMRIFTIKPFHRILSTCRNSPIFRFPPDNIPRYGSKSLHHRWQSVHQRAIESNRSPDLNWYQSRIFLGHCNLERNRGISVISNVRVRRRRLSTSSSVESNVSEKSFEQIRGQCLNVKPVVVERIEYDNVGKEENSRLDGSGLDVNVENSEGLGEWNVVLDNGREGLESDEEAWRLLRNAVVDYCKSPVGTVAVNDPADKVPLNYD